MSPCLSLALLSLGLLQFALCARYPVPTPPGGRNAVHGWLILPVDQQAPNASTPINAYFVHHTPEFWTDSPHNFQLILFGSMTPLSVAENITQVIDLPYPPVDNLVGTEYTFTPPPPFSLNDLLNGDIKSLLGVVFNGSFDTTYERAAMAIASLQIQNLTTAVWLNYSSAIPNYPEMRYLSYPRSLNTDSPDGLVHLYLSHEIHSPPDFDQVVHTTLDLGSCSCESGKCTKWKTEIMMPGAEWAFPGIENNITSKLMPADQFLAAQLLSGASQVLCKMTVLEQIHCVVGPAFGDSC